ncbi:MAG: hypothetical protein M1815_002715 [Lichina confinis]|nr:MAG: hypothetical protein M1815_002715 [Lichina confinis]
MDSRKGGFRNDSRLQDPVIVIDDSDDATKARSIDGNNRSAVEPRRRRPLPWTGREPDRHGQARRHAPVHVEKKFKWPDYLRSAEDGDPHLTGATAGRGDIRSSVPASTAAPASKNQARPHFKIPSGEGLFKDFSERTLERERVLKVQLTELEQEAERQRKVQRDLEVARRSLELQQERLQELSRRWSERARQLGLDAQDGSTLDKPECGNVAVRHGVDDAAARLAGTNSVNRVCEGSRPNTLLKSRQPNQTGKVAPRSAALRTAARLVSLKQALSRQQRSEGQSPKGPRCHVEELNFVSLDFSTVRAALSGSAPPAGNASSKPRPSQKAPFDQAMSCSDLVAPPNPAVASAQAPMADVEQPSGVPNTAPGQGSGGSEAVDEERREPAARADPGHEPTSSNHVPPPETTTRRDIISKAQTPFERLLGLPQDSAAVKKMIRQYIHFAAGRTQRVVLRKDRGRGGGGRGGGVGDDGGSGR